MNMLARLGLGVIFSLAWAYMMKISIVTGMPFAFAGILFLYLCFIHNDIVFAIDYWCQKVK